MPKPIRGRRAAPSTHNPAQRQLGGNRAKRTEVVADGDYTVVIEGAAVRASKATGNVSIQLLLKDVDTDTLINARPMLIDSVGGDSQLTTNNLALLEEIAGYVDDDRYTPDEMIERLTGHTVGVQLTVATDRYGQMVNTIVDLWSEEDGDE
jgi:hypothetical protein